LRTGSYADAEDEPFDLQVLDVFRAVPLDCFFAAGRNPRADIAGERARANHERLSAIVGDFERDTKERPRRPVEVVDDAHDTAAARSVLTIGASVDGG
jgi:hypothetical protein